MPTLPDDVRDVALRELPDLDLASAHVLGEGWNAIAWSVRALSTRWVIRVPKLDWAAGEIERQTHLGRHLSELGMPVPHGWRLFRNSNGAIIAGAYVYVSGELAPTRGKRQRDILAGEIANFLTRLHNLPTDVPLRECQALDLDPWSGRYRDLIAKYRSMNGPQTQSWLARTGARLERAMRVAPRHVLVHGDLAPEHVLCDAAGNVTGILDFSGPQVTDPALDFGRLIQRWGAPFADSTLRRYERPIDADFHERMDAYAKLEPLRAIEAGVLRELPDWIRWGQRRLAAAAGAERRSAPPPSR